MDTSATLSIDFQYEFGGKESFLCLQMPFNRVDWLLELCIACRLYLRGYITAEEAGGHLAWPWTRQRWDCANPFCGFTVQLLMRKMPSLPTGTMSSWHVYSWRLFQMHHVCHKSVSRDVLLIKSETCWLIQRSLFADWEIELQRGEVINQGHTNTPQAFPSKIH